jgi:cystathionine beta-lyase/cystathionine gamma-synthase
VYGSERGAPIARRYDGGSRDTRTTTMNDRARHDALSFATRCVHGPARPTPAQPALAPPIVLSTTFLQSPEVHALTDAGAWDTALVYSRYWNPTVAACEERLASLEGAEGAVLFGSGMAAMHAGLLALAEPGAPIALARQSYGGTRGLVEALAALGLPARDFDVGDPESLARALGSGARVVVCESISNPTMQVADVPSIARATHAAGARLLVDATFASPALQRPLELGADLVMHSATKYLGGHTDVSAGVLAGGGSVLRAAREWRKRAGGTLDSHAAYLLDRGVRTLALRVGAACAGAAALAEFLAEHPRVRAVHHPSLASHPSHALGAELLAAPGAMLAFELAGGDDALRPFVGRLELALDAPSLGGVETLVSLPRFMSHAAWTDEQRRAAGIRAGLVRVSVGIEDPRDLVADFDRALAS